MKYCLTFNKAQVSKVLSNEGLTVSNVSRKTGVLKQTFRDWLKKQKKVHPQRTNFLTVNPKRRKAHNYKSLDSFKSSC